MEGALAPQSAPPGILAAPAPVVLTLRRSHLDSASYRTLSRLFSHCLHLHPSRHAVPAHPEVEAAAANPVGYSGEPPQGGSAPTKDAKFDRGKDVEEEASVGSTSRETPAPAGVEAAAANPTADPGVAPQGSPEREVTGVERVDGVEEVVVAGSTCGKTDAVVEELGGGAGLLGEDEALRSMKACLEVEDEELVEVAVGNDDEQLLLDAMMTNFSGIIDDASGGTMSVQSCAVSGGDLQNDGKVAEEEKELGGAIEEGRPVDNSDHGSVYGGGFEEGEIEGDMQHLDGDESGNSGLGDEDADVEKLEEDFVSRGPGENESCDPDVRSQNLHSATKIKGNGDLVLNKEGNIKNDAQIPVARMQAVSYDEVVDWNETPLPDDETTKPEKKRKRQLTEERKAKKTENKRVKRAQQRIAEGVKRLKLQPVTKPKVLQYCRFYLHGKCQQGKMCKFSHDTTPLTKSKPCTHFARGSCLKDDCPYDHELSKYPCHNFLENGMCVRGDKCKFSHVMPTAEGPSTPDAKKPDVPLVSDKANRREQTSGQKTSTVCNGQPVTSAPTKHFSILKNLAGVSVNAQKTSARIPKGVQFLKDRPDSSILHEDALSTEKHRYTNGSQHHDSGGPQAAVGKEVVKQNGQRSAPLLEEKNLTKEAALHPCSEPKKTSLPTDSTAVPGSVITQHEVSEASRILQEFLFGAGN